MLRFLPAVFCGLLAGTAVAATPAPLRAFSSGLDALAGRFEQRVYEPGGRLREEASGNIALAKPRLFRWEYEQPFPQLIVADGDHVWVYDPDLEQVTVRRQSIEEQSSPLAVLIDPDELERQFELRALEPADGLQWLELTPRGEDTQLQSARIGLDGDRLRRMLLVDALGQRTEIEFSGWQRNPELPAGTFRFTPPEGVDVVGDIAPGADVFPIEG